MTVAKMKGRPMSDPVHPDQPYSPSSDEVLQKKIAAEMRKHYLNPKDMEECVCGDWSDDDMAPDDWDAHLAYALLPLIASVRQCDQPETD